MITYETLAVHYYCSAHPVRSGQALSIISVSTHYFRSE